MRRLGQAAAVLAVLVVSAALTHASETGAQKCAVAKMKAASKKLGSKVKCIQKAVAKGVAVDASCLSTADTKFTAAISKAEAKPGCVMKGDGPTFEALVDKDVSAIDSFADPKPLVCCAYPVGTACGWATDTAACTGGGGTPGASGTACDGGTGTCVVPPATKGNCCSIDNVSGGHCLGGPFWDVSTCTSNLGTPDPGSLCPPDGTGCVAF
jgi:hypothetical protein